jgi:hypothetical protein
MHFIIFNVLCILMVLFISYWWATQGLFSAIIHLLCVVTAGALALAAWEPLTLGLLLRGGKFDGYAWSFALVGVFVVALFVLRLITNKLVPANVDLPQWANLAFGFPVGAVSGVLTVGILMLGVGFVQSQREIMGFEGAARNKTGSVVRIDSMWIPFHEITGEFYGYLSVGALRSGRPLRQYYPDLAQVSWSLARDSFRNGRGQTTMRPSHAQVMEAWVCPSRCVAKVRFGRGARDYGQQLTISSAQIRLVSAASGLRQPTLVEHPSRWRQATPAAGDQTFAFNDISHYITTVPGRETADILIEFPWREGVVPRFIQIKGVRFDVPRLQSLTDPACDGIMGGASTATATAPPVSGGGRLNPSNIRLTTDIRPVSASANMLPGSINANDERFLTDGEGVFPSGGKTHVARNLRIVGIHEPPGTRVIQLEVDRRSSANIYGAVRSQASDDAMPVLVDSGGNTYTAVGYIHEGPGGVSIKLDPANGISLGQLPHVPTAGGEKLRLVFQVTEGTQLVGFRLGDVPVVSCNLGVPAKS